MWQTLLTPNLIGHKYHKAIPSFLGIAAVCLVSATAFSGQNEIGGAMVKSKPLTPEVTPFTTSLWKSSPNALDLSYLRLGENLNIHGSHQQPMPVPVPTPLIIGVIGLVATIAIRGKVRN